MFPSSCRYYPTCSEYALEAFQKLGFFKAFYLTSKRILTCNPFFPGGYDPVPGEHKHIHLKHKTEIDLKKYYEIL